MTKLELVDQQISFIIFKTPILMSKQRQTDRQLKLFLHFYLLNIDGVITYPGMGRGGLDGHHWYFLRLEVLCSILRNVPKNARCSDASIIQK